MKANFVSEDVFLKHENEWLAINRPEKKIAIGARRSEYFPTKVDRTFENNIRDLAKALNSNRN